MFSCSKVFSIAEINYYTVIDRRRMAPDEETSGDESEDEHYEEKRQPGEGAH